MARDKDLDDVVAHLADQQHGAFTTEQAGCDRRLAAQRAARREWLRFLPGTYCLPGCLDEWTAIAAMCLHVPESVATGVEAARWWRFEGVQPRASSLLVPPSCRTRSPMLRRVDDLAPWEVVHEVDGCIRVTDPTRTLIELGVDQDPSNLERAVESALRRGQTSEPRLRTRATQLRRQGRRGPSALLAVLDARPSGAADSDGEVILLQLLRAAGAPQPVRQERLGRWRFDLAWPDAKVAVELDGSTHRSEERRRLDARKQNDAVLAGWTLLRFTWDRVASEPDVVVAEILAALAGAAAR